MKQNPLKVVDFKNVLYVGYSLGQFVEVTIWESSMEKSSL